MSTRRAMGYTSWMTNPQHVEYLAHHWILLALPAFLPAIVVVAVVLYVAMRDRRSDDKTENSNRSPETSPDKRD